MLVRDLSYVLGFRAPTKPRKREQLDLFAAPGPRQLALGETAPYPAPPREVPPQVPMFTGPAAAPASKPARPRRAPAAAARLKYSAAARWRSSRFRCICAAASAGGSSSREDR